MSLGMSLQSSAESNRWLVRYLTIYTAAGATWPWQVAALFSSSPCSGVLNYLVKKYA